MKIFFKSIVFLILLVLVTLTFCVFLSLQSTPLVLEKNSINADTAKISKNAIRRVVKSFNAEANTTVVKLSAHDLKSISALANRSVPNLSADISLQPSVALASMSYELPLPESFRYLNISAVLYSSTYGLSFGDVDIGSLSLSGSWLMRSVKWALNTFAQPELGDKAFSTVEWVTISRNSMVFNVQLPDEFQNIKADGKSSIIALRDKLSVFGDVNKVKSYYSHITQVTDENIKASLPDLISQLFIFAQTNSRALDNDDLVEENRAALTALVIYLGSNKFEMFVGNISNLTFKQKTIRNKLRSSLTLHNRVDLQKHFIYSMALQLFSTQATSDAIGEMKEFIDSNKGGTGFSFPDLLADRTGTRLALLATKNETAFRFQKKLSQIKHEYQLIPEIHDLSEGISRQEFEQTYKDIHSKEYKAMLSSIDKRIMKLPLYRE